MKSMIIIPTLKRKSREGKRKLRKENLEKKMALSTTAEEEACDDLQGKRYPILIIKIKKLSDSSVMRAV